MKLDTLAIRDVAALLLIAVGGVAACAPENMRFYRHLQLVAGISMTLGLILIGSGLWLVASR